MNFLPNKTERYLAAWRLLIQRKILESGVTPQNIRRLKKIYLAEAFLNRHCLAPADPVRYSDILLGAASLLLFARGFSIRFAFSGGGTVLLPRRLFAAFLLNLAARTKNGGTVRVVFTRGLFSVRASGYTHDRRMEKIARALGMTHLKAVSRPDDLFYFKPIPTKEPPMEEPNEWLYLTDGFSVVHLYLEDSPDPDRAP